MRCLPCLYKHREENFKHVYKEAIQYKWLFCEISWGKEGLDGEEGKCQNYIKFQTETILWRKLKLSKAIIS